MSTVLTTRSSAYLTALTQEIEKKLQRTSASPSQRRNLLQELFADKASEVHDRARDIILSGEQRSATVEDQTEGPICFYDVLADHFVSVPQNGRPVLDLIVQLWSQSFASIFLPSCFTNGCLSSNLTTLKFSSVIHLRLFKALQMSSGLTFNRTQGAFRVSFCIFWRKLHSFLSG